MQKYSMQSINTYLFASFQTVCVYLPSQRKICDGLHHCVKSKHNPVHHPSHLSNNKRKHTMSVRGIEVLLTKTYHVSTMIYKYYSFTILYTSKCNGITSLYHGTVTVFFVKKEKEVHKPQTGHTWWKNSIKLLNSSGFSYWQPPSDTKSNQDIHSSAGALYLFWLLSFSELKC